jgi:hypothetical protein
MELSRNCHALLYRIIWEHADGPSIAVFTLAESRESARETFNQLVPLIGRCAPEDIQLHTLLSFRDLVDQGVSDDEDMRIFETAWHGTDISEWAKMPLFLSDDPTLPGKWAEMMADLAARDASDAIARARSDAPRA